MTEKHHALAFEPMMMHMSEAERFDVYRRCTSASGVSPGC